jgi:hypothetical protein
MAMACGTAILVLKYVWTTVLLSVHDPSLGGSFLLC